MSDASLGLIVVAAGSSRRMGGADKIWEPVAGRPLVWYSLATLTAGADQAVLVVHPDRMAQAHALLTPAFPRLMITAGGPERHDSVQHGLQRLRQVEMVAVHDAARPLVPRSLLTEGRRLLASHAGAIPVVPVSDTIKCIAPSGLVADTLDRSALGAAQTPQLFRATCLREAYRRAAAARWQGTDDASLMEWAEYGVVTFPGDRANFKVTTPLDLEVVRLLVEAGWPA